MRRYRSGIIDQGFGDAGCTIKQALPVNAQKSSGTEADSGKGGIAAAQKIRGFERNKVFPADSCRKALFEGRLQQSSALSRHRPGSYAASCGQGNTGPGVSVCHRIC